ncbi:hypothetical protein CYPRO_2990 [Cyclonatronum proteinivorum]|uniref:Uncharacterized protein n=1 Tax=Cyclonatronum proteinivorum TaxID=1457365 RepID=A0A345UP25_9BACT|nr:hypothetical protein [Cyclonatronum proteinivorum]AXJ02227.1 hypothetical protein CYPRO_2990 [Cyclonatronum proteinivorum]
MILPDSSPRAAQRNVLAYGTSEKKKARRKTFVARIPAGFSGLRFQEA